MRFVRSLFVLVIVVIVAASTAGGGVAAEPPAGEPIVIQIFHGDGCPYCARALAFLDDLDDRHPSVQVDAREVWYDAENRAVFESVAAAHGVDARAVPTIILGDLVWVGFDSTVATQIEDAVATLEVGREPEEAERTSVDVPLVGPVDVGESSLVLATLLIGFVDGINPCSLWVLSILLALVVRSGSRGRILAVGSVFLTVTAALYGLYMVGAYSALSYADEMAWVRLAVAALVGVLGILHLKEYVTHRGPSVTLASRSKKRVTDTARALAQPDRALPAVLASTAALAVGVSLAETPCTAGLPLLWTNLLSDRGVSAAEAALLFALYLVVFLADELVIFALAVTTMRSLKLQERHGQVLQLIGGTLMLALALTMAFRPQLLETVAGTVAVFTAAAAEVLVVLTFDRHRRPTTRRRPRPSPAHHRATG